MNGKAFASMHPWGGRGEEWKHRLQQRHTVYQIGKETADLLDSSQESEGKTSPGSEG